MAFPTTGLLTNFLGTDEDPLSEGGDWDGPFNATGQLKRASNAAASNSGNGVLVDSYWTDTFGPDCEVFTTLSAQNGFETFRMFIRGINPDTASTSGYVFIFTNGGTSEIARIDDTVETTLDVNAFSLSNGNKFGVEAIGDTIAVYKDTGGGFSLIFDSEDGTYADPGVIGMGTDRAATVYDDFSGGDVITPPAPTLHMITAGVSYR